MAFNFQVFAVAASHYLQVVRAWVQARRAERARAVQRRDIKASSSTGSLLGMLISMR